jgi:DNA mismatch repair protein MutL
MEALGQSGAPELQLRPETAVQSPSAPPLPGVLSGGVYPNRWMPRPEASEAQLVPDAAAYPGLRSLTEAQAGLSSRSGGIAPSDIRPMIPLGQFRDTFIIAIDDEGVAIIDQHVAHERVLFERVMQRLSEGPLESQRLLVPIVMDLAPSAHQTLVTRARELERFGFELESFGPTSIRVTAVPALLKTGDSAKALRTLAEDLEGLDRGSQVQDALQRIAATTACHAAVKAHDALTYEKMSHILDELRATAYSTVCPHGRPVMLRLTRREIEKNFDRI